MFGRNKKMTDVLVVGAGPVGLFSALALAERGAVVSIVDERPSAAGVDYGVLLHPRTLELLDRRGLVEPLLARGEPVFSLALHDVSGASAQIGLFGVGAAFDHALVVRQRALEDVLTGRLAEHKVHVQWENRLARFVSGGSDVAVTLDKLEQRSVGYAIAHTETEVTKSYERRTRFIIGADGQRSLIRRQLDIGYPRVGPTQPVALFEGRPTKLVRDEIRLIFTSEGTVTAIWPLPEGRCRWVFESNELPVEPDAGKRPAVLQTGELHLKRLGREAFADYRRQCASPHCPDATEISLAETMSFEHRLADSFGSGRIWLVGDAGHAANAATGHSLNAGLGEAGALAARIGEILEGEGALGTLQRYERQRQRAWRELLERPELATDRAEPWISDRADRVLDMLPASGRDRAVLAARLGIDVVGATRGAAEQQDPVSEPAASPPRWSGLR